MGLAVPYHLRLCASLGIKDNGPKPTQDNKGTE